MIKSCHLALLLSLVSQSNAQKNLSDKKSSLPPIRLTLEFSPDRNYRTLVNTNNDPFADKIINIRNNSEIPRIGYSAQLNLAVDITKKTSIEMGLGYRDMGYTYDQISVIRGNNTYLANLEDHYIYYSIPLKIRRTTGNKKWQLTYHLGFSTNFFGVQKTNVISTSDPSISDFSIKNMDGSSSYNKMIFIPSIGIGTIYNFNSKSQICLEPTLRYSISSVTQNKPINGYLYNVGLNLAYRLKLN